MNDCPYGGECIDPGMPSDCEMNSRCFNFSTVEEKLEFDIFPDEYLLVNDGTIIKFKNKTQVIFFLRDVRDWLNCDIYLIDTTGRKLAKIDFSSFI